MQACLGRRFYYGWIVVDVTFATLLVAAGIRSAPAVLTNPLEDDLGWTRTSISFGVSIGLLLYGLTSPAAGMKIRLVIRDVNAVPTERPIACRG